MPDFTHDERDEAQLVMIVDGVRFTQSTQPDAWTWRSDDRRIVVTKNYFRKTFSATVDGRIDGISFRSLENAMRAGIKVLTPMPTVYRWERTTYDRSRWFLDTAHGRYLVERVRPSARTWHARLNGKVHVGIIECRSVEEIKRAVEKTVMATDFALSKR